MPCFSLCFEEMLVSSLKWEKKLRINGLNKIKVLVTVFLVQN